jgi:hypothetical protein
MFFDSLPGPGVQQIFQVEHVCLELNLLKLNLRYEDLRVYVDLDA